MGVVLLESGVFLGSECRFLPMDPTEIANLVEKFKLTAEATEDGVNLTPNLVALTHERAAKCLVGKIFASRVVNREALRAQLPQILQIRSDFEIEIVGDNLFLIAFSSPADRRHTLLHGPWHFFQSLLLFKEPKGFQKPSEVCFDEFSIWIQCHNVPISCMDPIIIRKIGEKLGRVEEVDMGEGGSCMGMYARVRVSRQVDLPLRCCISLNAANNSSCELILLRYERLPDFCYACGCVTHTIRECTDEKADKKNLMFGCWLRAGRTQDVRRKKNNGRTDADLNNRDDTALVKCTQTENEQILYLDKASSNGQSDLRETKAPANTKEGDKVVAAGTMEEDRVDVDGSENDTMIIEVARLEPEATKEKLDQQKGTPQNPSHRSWKRLARQPPKGKQEHVLPSTTVDQTVKRKADSLLEEDVTLKQVRFSPSRHDSDGGVTKGIECSASNITSSTAEAAVQPLRSQ